MIPLSPTLSQNVKYKFSNEIITKEKSYEKCLDLSFIGNYGSAHK